MLRGFGKGLSAPHRHCPPRNWSRENIRSDATHVRVFVENLESFRAAKAGGLRKALHAVLVAFHLRGSVTVRGLGLLGRCRRTTRK
jgi:hypothetical protein